MCYMCYMCFMCFMCFTDASLACWALFLILGSRTNLISWRRNAKKSAEYEKRGEDVSLDNTNKAQQANDASVKHIKHMKHMKHIKHIYRIIPI